MLTLVSIAFFFSFVLAVFKRYFNYLGRQRFAVNLKRLLRSIRGKKNIENSNLEEQNLLIEQEESGYRRHQTPLRRFFNVSFLFYKNAHVIDSYSEGDISLRNDGFSVSVGPSLNRETVTYHNICSIQLVDKTSSLGHSSPDFFETPLVDSSHQPLASSHSLSILPVPFFHRNRVTTSNISSSLSSLNVENRDAKENGQIDRSKEYDSESEDDTKDVKSNLAVFERMLQDPEDNSSLPYQRFPNVHSCDDKKDNDCDSDDNCGDDTNRNHTIKTGNKANINFTKESHEKDVKCKIMNLKDAVKANSVSCSADEPAFNNGNSAKSIWVKNVSEKEKDCAPILISSIDAIFQPSFRCDDKTTVYKSNNENRRSRNYHYLDINKAVANNENSQTIDIGHQKNLESTHLESEMNRLRQQRKHKPRKMIEITTVNNDVYIFYCQEVRELLRSLKWYQQRSTLIEF